MQEPDLQDIFPFRFFVDFTGGWINRPIEIGLAYMRAGTFPKPIALGPQTVAFLDSDILDWMKQQVLQQGSSDGERRARAEYAVKQRKTQGANR